MLFDVKIPSTQAWSNMVYSKAWVYLLLTGLFVSIHNPMQVQLGQWGSNHWASHHRCLQLFGKLAAVLAQTVWPEPKWPLANHTLLKSFCIFSLWPSAPSQSNIFFFFPPRHLRNLNSVCRNDRIWSVITLDWMGEI